MEGEEAALKLPPRLPHLPFPALIDPLTVTLGEGGKEGVPVRLGVKEVEVEGVGWGGEGEGVGVWLRAPVRVALENFEGEGEEVPVPPATALFPNFEVRVAQEEGEGERVPLRLTVLLTLPPNISNP